MLIVRILIYICIQMIMLLFLHFLNTYRCFICTSKNVCKFLASKKALRFFKGRSIRPTDACNAPGVTDLNNKQCGGRNEGNGRL